jgi:hypothetical protein
LSVGCQVIVYSRRGCHLCEHLLVELQPLVRDLASVVVRDVDDRPEWLADYGQRVPVVCIDDREICHFYLDRGAVMDSLPRQG